jgi:hypothetical protein
MMCLHAPFETFAIRAIESPTGVLTALVDGDSTRCGG